MILKLYVVRDEVSIENHVLLTAQNDTILKRNVKAVLLSREPNYINTNTKDKRIFLAGELDDQTGVITSVNPIVPVFTIEEVRLELMDEINMEKAKLVASKQKAADFAGIPVEALDEKEVQENA